MMLSCRDGYIPVVVKKDDIGMFDVAYEISDIEPGTMQEIVNWLSNNCRYNFVVVRTISDIAAGGYVDNKGAFKKGLFNLGRKKNQEDLVHRYQVKLSTYDNVMFSMVWLAGNKSGEV